MARNTKRISHDSIEEIPISAFKEINIHFSGDVYLLAVWLVMSDRAKSTRTRKTHTMLHGLANEFSSLYGTDHSNPLNSDEVMAIFRRHGIKGNPALKFDNEGEPPATISLKIGEMAEANTGEPANAVHRPLSSSRAH